MRILHLSYLLSIICLLSLSLQAQDNGSWTLTHFNSENGLPQNSVIGAEIDKDGYLWLATQSGIARYDGQRFRIYDNNNSTLLRNRYLSFGKDWKGNVLCLDEDGKTAFYDNQTGFSKPRAIPGLVRTTSGGMIDITHIDMAPLARYTGKFSYIPSENCLDFLYHPVSKGRGFMAWRYNIGYVSNGRLKWTRLPEIATPQILAVGAVGDKLCFVTRSREAVLVDSNGVHVRKKIPVAFPQNKSLVNLSSVKFFKQENQMLLNLDGDIFEVRLAGSELKFRHLIKVKDISFITCMRYYPEQGLLIIGSNTQGLFIFRKQNLAAVGENEENGGAFYGLAPYGDGGIFSPIGTLPGSPSVPGTRAAVNRRAVLRDRNGHYWYSHLFTLQETDEKMRVLRKVPLTEWLACVQEDETGTIWINQGSRNFGRVQGEKFVPYDCKSLSGKYIESFIPLGNQTFWIVGTGLCMWLDVKHRRQRIYHEFDKIELRTVYRDKQGNLWMGSYGQGYFLFRNGRFMKMPEDRGHHLRIVHSFLEDRNGFIWMTTNNGLFQCAVQDLYDYASGKPGEIYQHYYGKESGLKTTEFNGGCTPSGLRLDNGTFAFPSMNGVVVFHPDSIKPVLPANKIFIEQV